MNKNPGFQNIPTLLLLTLLFSFSCAKRQEVYPLDPKHNSHIIFLGNTFAEQLQHHNYFETLLYTSFPGRNLRVRNIAWSADEVNLQPRPLNFGTLEEHLKQQKADIIFVCFGLNEAFKGLDSLQGFKHHLFEFLQHLQQQKFNEQTVPEIILVSPIAHEKLGGFLPDPARHNENLQLYTKGMQEVAQSLSIPFINLYEPTRKLMENEVEPLTVNGIQLSDRGYKEVSEMMAMALDLPVASWVHNSQFSDLKEVINHKNQQFFYRFRTQNAEYIYGRRKDWPGGGSFPSELKKLDKIVNSLDSLIWTASKDANGLYMEKVQQIIHGPKEVKSLLVGTSEYPPSTDQFILQDGYQIELFASEVDFPIENPVALTFDPQGRMWVASMPSYPNYYPGSPPNDKIVILEDMDQDGKADQHTVFADSLYLPLGFELGDGGVYVTQSPDFVFLKDTDGDGRADHKKTLLHGFGTEDSHHSLSAYTWGPDGALYMHMGTFLHSQIETPYGPKRGAYGTTWRYEPLTMRLDPYVSYPYANPWGNVFMRNGTHLIGDVSTGMNYFATPLTVATDFPKKHVEMRDFLATKVKPKTCGHEIISSRHFPESVQGNILFNTFIGFQGIKQHTIAEEGSGIIAHETEPLLQSKDLNFRPVDLQFGPDGALYVVDWFNPIIQHGEQAFRESRRDHTHGRIWRITYKGKDLLKPTDLTQLGIDELLDQLKVYEDRVRYRTRMQLREFSEDEALPSLGKWLGQLNPEDPDYEQHQLEGLWVYQQFNRPNEKLLHDLLRAKSHHVRAAATRVLFYWHEQINNAQEKLIAMSKDHAPRVRLEAIAALSHFKSEAAVKALLAITELPMDYYIEYALQEALKHLQPVWMAMFQKDNNFLTDEPEKANFLLYPLSSPNLLALPGFITDDPEWTKYARNPLSQEDYEALSDATAVIRFRITRKDVSDTTREQGIKLLAERTGQRPIDILLEAISSLDHEHDDHGLSELSKILMEQNPDEIIKKEKDLEHLAETAKKIQVKALCFALLMDISQDISAVRQMALKSGDNLLAYMNSARWVRAEKSKSALYPEIVNVLNGDLSIKYNSQQRQDLKVAAIEALAYMDHLTRDAVAMLTRFVQPNGVFVEQAAKSLLLIPDERLAKAEIQPLKNNILKIIRSIPEKDRIKYLSNHVVKLGNEVATLLPKEEADPFLTTLSKAEKVVIRVATLPGKMDFNLESFTVVAGKSVEIIFANPDDMPHNLLILKPGSLKEVGTMADDMAKTADGYEKNFIPNTDKVLFATPLVNSSQTYTLTFVAPDQLGEFPFACTFPGHWQTMNGMMTVESQEVL